MCTLNLYVLGFLYTEEAAVHKLYYDRNQIPSILLIWIYLIIFLSTVSLLFSAINYFPDVCSLACHRVESGCAQRDRGPASDSALCATGWQSTTWEAVATQLRPGEDTQRMFTVCRRLVFTTFQLKLIYWMCDLSGNIRPVCDGEEGRQSTHWEDPAGRCGGLHLLGRERGWSCQRNH